MVGSKHTYVRKVAIQCERWAIIRTGNSVGLKMGELEWMGSGDATSQAGNAEKVRKERRIKQRSVGGVKGVRDV
jgi:hypothetical protein